MKRYVPITIAFLALALIGSLYGNFYQHATMIRRQIKSLNYKQIIEKQRKSYLLLHEKTKY